MPDWLLQIISRNEKELVVGLIGLLGVIVGALFTLAGSLFAPFVELKLVRRRRMEDEMAARRITASASAYKQVKELVSLTPALIPPQLDEWATKTNVWFLDHRLFLPGTFPTKWIAMRKVIHDMARLSKLKQYKHEDMEKLIKEAERLGTEALHEITNDLKLDDIDVDNP